MSILEIDEKYSIEYDDGNNDSPLRILRYGREWVDWDEITIGSNAITAMFYQLLDSKSKDSI